MPVHSCFNKFTNHNSLIHLGILCYLIFMSTPIYSSELSQRYAYYQEAQFCSQAPALDTTSLAQEFKRLKSEFNSSQQTGVYVLESGLEALISRAWLSQQATQTIDIQYFIFTSDNLGLIAVDYLVRAAKRGVQVRILVDDFMLDADVHDLIALNSHPNITIKLYNPNINIGKSLPQKIKATLTDFRGINQRMHNKSFTVDEAFSITGGRNVADEYFGFDHEYNFKDRDVLLTGKSITNITKSFNQFWNHSLAQPLEKVAKIRTVAPWNFQPLHEYACDPDNYEPSLKAQIHQSQALTQILTSPQFQWVDSLQYISDVPGKNDGKSGLKGGGKTTQELVKLIDLAKKHIWIQTPYLITSQLGYQVLERAIKRGVQVKILTNSLGSTDNLEAFNGYQRVRQELLKLGVEIYEFKPQAKLLKSEVFPKIQQKHSKQMRLGLHSKSMIIDDKISMIGTFNLDPRSAHLNTESIAIIHSHKITQQLYRQFQHDMAPANAWKTTTQSNPDKESSHFKRIQIWLRGWVPKSIL